MGKLALFKFANFVSIVLTFILMVFTILGAFAIYVHPKQNMFVTTLGLALPVLLIICLVVFIYWTCRRKWWALFPLIGIAANYAFISGMFQFPREIVMPNNRTLTVMTLNARNFVDDDQDDSVDNINTFMEEKDVQVVCFQEYRDFVSLRPEKVCRFLSHKFPYYSVSGSVAIFSKYPITKKDYMTFRDTNNSAQWADVQIGKDQMIRIINVHLQTTGVNSTLKQASKLEEYGLPVSSKYKANMLNQRMGYEFCRRAEQADMVSDLVKEAPYPVILCGDLNDTPASYTYNRVKGKLKDGFKTAGKGYMYTYKGGKGLMRIDYIFHSPSLTGIKYYSTPQNWSDHNPVVMELNLPTTRYR